jgi:hypothetical protein
MAAVHLQFLCVVTGGYELTQLLLRLLPALLLL